jgi:hypothetical protein
VVVSNVVVIARVTISFLLFLLHTILFIHFISITIYINIAMVLLLSLSYCLTCTALSKFYSFLSSI